jgi:hypothetical protein
MSHDVQTLKNQQYTFNDKANLEAMHSWLQDAGTDFCSWILKLE